MTPMILHLDDATLTLLDQAARVSGMSKSRWVAEIIRKHAFHEWPQDCLALAGRFADFPLTPAEETADVPRVGF